MLSSRTCQRFWQSSNKPQNLLRRYYSTSSDSEVQVSTLKNGVRVATLSTNQQYTSAGFLINAGSRFETPDQSGIFNFIKHMGFKSTPSKSSLRLVREFELAGAQFSICSGREQMLYVADFPTNQGKEVLPLLHQTLSPSFEYYEIKDEVPLVLEETKKIESDPNSVLFEVLHQEAFRNRGLGNTVYTPSWNANSFTQEQLRNTVSDFYSKNRIVLVGVGPMKHESFVEFAEKADFYDGSGKGVPSSKYFGGDARLASNGPNHVGIAFQGVPLSSMKNYLSLGVLKNIFGASRSYPKEGPGRGLSGRLNTEVVSKNSDWVYEASTFNLGYSDNGLFGVVASCQRGKADHLISQLTAQISAVANGKFQAEEFERARSLLKANILFNDSPRDQLQFIGERILFSKPYSPMQACQLVDTITLQDVQQIASSVLKSKPTLAVLGDVSNVPTVADIQSQI